MKGVSEREEGCLFTRPLAAERGVGNRADGNGPKGGRMKLEEIRRIAQGVGIRPRGMKKGELIRNIQKTENNIPCYGTVRVDHCNETRCLWHGDCRREREVTAGHS